MPRVLPYDGMSHVKIGQSISAVTIGAAGFSERVLGYTASHPMFHVSCSRSYCHLSLNAA
jgi:hypothetical protein